MIFIESLPVVLRIKRITRGMQPSSDLLEFSRYDLARFGNLMFAIFCYFATGAFAFLPLCKNNKIDKMVKKGFKNDNLS